MKAFIELQIPRPEMPWSDPGCLRAADGELGSDRSQQRTSRTSSSSVGTSPVDGLGFSKMLESSAGSRELPKSFGYSGSGRI